MEVTEQKALPTVCATYQCEVRRAQGKALYFAVGAGHARFLLSEPDAVRRLCLKPVLGRHCNPWHSTVLQTPASKVYIHLTVLHFILVLYMRHQTLQYWSNYLKLLMEKLWLHPLNCFLGKGSEDALWGQAFCQVSYSPMAGNPCRRGLQDSPQQSSTENAGKQTNGSIFWCPMSHCSSPFWYSVSSAWGIKEGGACG